MTQALKIYLAEEAANTDNLFEQIYGHRIVILSDRHSKKRGASSAALWDQLPSLCSYHVLAIL